MPKYIGQITKCQICSNKSLTTILSLGHQPIVQEYLTAETLREPETTYPLNLARCNSCGLLQLDYIVDPKLVFPKNYPYRTGLTNMLIRNFRDLANTLFEKFKPSENDLIIDIGSNDGTLLQGFKEKGMTVLGIEPTDAAKVANKNKIPTLQEFLNKKVVAKAVKKYGRAKFVTATNVFAHINNTKELISNIKNLLGKDGIFISESQYLMDIVEKFEFDTIYHEHLRFYSLKPLIKLHELGGLSIIDAERISAAGGSIRVYAKRGKHPMSERAKELITAEEKAGLYNEASLKDFADRAIKAKHALLALLIKCKTENAKIVGVGSPARSNTLLGFSNIDNNILDYAFEKSGSPKIGLYTPGTHIRVIDEKQFFIDQPDYALVLSWHIGEELIKKLRELGYKGKFIMPLPTPTIVG